MIRSIYKSLPKSIRYQFEPLVFYFRKLRNRYLFKPAPFRDFPQIIQVETSSFCNGSCIFCPYATVRGSMENKLLSLEIFKKIMDECSSYDIKIIYLCLMNEPLADKRIIDLINYTKSKNPNAQVKIITNAKFLSSDIVNSIINSKLDEIRFSFHGWTDYTHRKVMGIDFDTTFKNLIHLLQMNKGNNLRIGMVCVRTKYFTKRDYYVLYDFCKRYKIDFGLAHICNIAENHDPEIAVELGLKKIRRRKLRGCIDNWPLISFHITYDGKVVACCMDWYQEVILGNIYQDTIYEIWNSHKYQEFRDTVYNNRLSREDFICKRCSESI